MSLHNELSSELECGILNVLSEESLACFILITIVVKRLPVAVLSYVLRILLTVTVL